jgi:hypothetical protein
LEPGQMIVRKPLGEMRPPHSCLCSTICGASAPCAFEYPGN